MCDWSVGKATMNKKVTIKQIAQMANVHRSTVDKVLHNRPGVSHEMRTKIQDIINVLDYKPNAIGKALKYQQQRHVIAAVLLHVYSQVQIQQGLERAQQEFDLFGFDLELYYTNLNDIAGQESILHMLAERKVSGVILQALFNDSIVDAVQSLTASNIPVVLINTDLLEGSHTCYIGQNCRVAAHTAARLTKEFLHGKGNVAIINGSYSYLHAIYERSNAYAKHLEEICPEIRIVEIVDSTEDEHQMFQSTMELLSRRQDIDCLHVTTGGLEGVWQAIKLSGLGNKIKIICYDLYPDVVELIRQGVVLATICQGLNEQGYLSYKTLVNQLFYDELPNEKNLYSDVDIRLYENTIL
mgnify:CR=1 FL=1